MSAASLALSAPRLATHLRGPWHHASDPWAPESVRKSGGRRRLRSSNLKRVHASRMMRRRSLRRARPVTRWRGWI
eukprot:903573-Rhodomonas_salina.2